MIDSLGKKEDSEQQYDPEPRWPALVAIIAVVGLYLALPPQLTLGPGWFIPSIILALSTLLMITHYIKSYNLNVYLSYLMNGVLTVELVMSLGLLLKSLPLQKQKPTELLSSAASLWITNILVFALWYWRLDAGGPHIRDRRIGHSDGSFLFPQMMLSETELRRLGQQHWTPKFVDYLFLAFNTSTALSPTDVPILDRWAKILMMLQALVSLLIIVLLAAHAINIL